MKKISLCILLITLMLVGCSKQEVLEKLNLVEKEVESEVIETEPVVLAPEFLKDAVAAYADEIGTTTPGTRIVERRDTSDTVEFSIYKFDEEGFIHSYYYFAFDDSKFEFNQNERLNELDYIKDSLVIDNTYRLVKFDLEYVTIGNNAYNYFRDVISTDIEKQLVDLYGEMPDEIPDKIVYLQYTYSIVGTMDKYIPAIPELQEDDEGYTLCDSSDRLWTYISSGNGEIIITGYKNIQYGNKLIIPKTINGKNVYAVRHLEPIDGVTCVEVSEGISELQGAFTGWSDLNRVILHEGLISITQEALSGTSVKSVNLPHSIVNLEDRFFANLDVGNVLEFDYDITRITGFFRDSNIVSIIIPKHVAIIDFDAFDGCNQLTTVFIEDGCSVIEDRAFKGASNLQAVAIPESVTRIGVDAFNTNTLLVVKAGSYAESYAKANNLAYSAQ